MQSLSVRGLALGVGVAAGLIFFVGLIIARIVRRLAETVLIATNVDGLLARIGIGDTTGTVRTDPNAVPPGAAPGSTRASVARAADSASASAPSQNRALSSSTVSFGVKRAGSIQR